MVRYAVSIVCAALCALLAACSVGPDYVRPQAMTEIPNHFKETEGWKIAEPGNSPLPEMWWELYADPQLNQLEEELLAANQSIRQAEAQFRQAQALVQSARAGYFPNLNLGASAIRSQRSPNAPGGTGTAAASPVWDYQMPVALPWEIDL